MRPSRSLRLLGYSLLPLLFLLVACDSGGTGDNEEAIDNRFRLEINEVSSSTDGQATVSSSKALAELNGYSFFAEGSDPETGESGFGIYFNDSESFGEQSAQQGLFGVAARQGGQPSTGLFPVDTSETAISAGNALVMLLFENVGDDQGMSYYLGTGGTIDFETSTDQRISGTLDVNALRIQLAYTDTSVVSDTTSVEITGEFTAKNGDTYLSPEMTSQGGW